MIPAPFAYEAAESAGHALDLLARHGEDAKLLAGGHSLLPMMKLRLAVPSVVIDIGRVAELAGIRADGDDLVIGATTCHADIAASGLVRSQAPLLAHAAAQVGDPQIRHRGTIGGSLAHADPAADLPMALVALGGSVEISGPGGRRTVSADDFFAGFFETSLEADELLTAIRVPRQPGPDWGYQKFVRRANDWAIVGVAAAGGRIALANMGPVPGPGGSGRAGPRRRGQRRGRGRAGRRGYRPGRGHPRRPCLPSAPGPRPHPPGPGAPDGIGPARAEPAGRPRPTAEVGAAPWRAVPENRQDGLHDQARGLPGRAGLSMARGRVLAPAAGLRGSTARPGWDRGRDRLRRRGLRVPVHRGADRRALPRRAGRLGLPCLDHRPDPGAPPHADRRAGPRAGRAAAAPGTGAV